MLEAGVRQGCPGSMLIFNLVSDPVLVWFAVRYLGPGDLHWVYADDWLFSLRHSKFSLPRMAVGVKVIKSGTGLGLKFKKC